MSPQHLDRGCMAALQSLEGLQLRLEYLLKVKFSFQHLSWQPSVLLPAHFSRLLAHYLFLPGTSDHFLYKIIFQLPPCCWMCLSFFRNRLLPRGTTCFFLVNLLLQPFGNQSWVCLSQFSSLSLPLLIHLIVSTIGDAHLIFLLIKFTNTHKIGTQADFYLPDILPQYWLVFRLFSTPLFARR